MNYVKDYDRLIASRDHEKGIFRVRVDYMANGDETKFYTGGDKAFSVSKKILHRTKSGITYTIVVENIGENPIIGDIVLYSDNNGVFTNQKIFKRNVVGKDVPIKGMRVGQKSRVMFLVKQIDSKEEAMELIKDLTGHTLYGRKVLSIFERLSENLRDDRELFIEGLKHNPMVLSFASDKLRKDPELLEMQIDKLVDME